MNLSADLQSLALALRAAQDARRADPLAGFGWPSEKHKRAFAYVVQGLELHLRAANGELQRGLPEHLAPFGDARPGRNALKRELERPDDRGIRGRAVNEPK